MPTCRQEKTPHSPARRNPPQTLGDISDKENDEDDVEEECQDTTTKRRLNVQPIGIPPQTWVNISDKEKDDDDMEDECQHTAKKRRLTVQPIGITSKDRETYLTKKIMMMIWMTSANIPPRKDALYSSPKESPSKTQGDICDKDNYDNDVEVQASSPKKSPPSSPPVVI